MKINKVKNVDELFELISSFSNCCVYRGQANSEWSLNSALDRACPSEKRIHYEIISLQEFKRNAIHYLMFDKLPSSTLGWLSIMQHHGIPTRLVDFSESPFIALFFAITPMMNCYNSFTEGAIFVLDYRKIMKISKEKGKSIGINWDILLPDKNDALFDICSEIEYSDNIPTLGICLEPSITNLRLHRQQGTFFLSSNIRKSISETLSMDYYQDDVVSKIVFPEKIKYDIYNRLRLMNINFSNLYCDIDGFSKDIVNRMNFEIHNMK